MEIVQFSPWRSGSTLVWNILKEFYPDIKKLHNLKNYHGQIKVVSTIRDPRDILCSRLRVSNEEINRTNLKLAMKNLIKYGLDDLVEIKDHPDVLVLKYEHFWNNYSYIFDQLEPFLGIKIDLDKREQITNKFRVGEMVKISKKYEDFNDYDQITHIHGDHISKMRGAPGGWKSIIPAEHHALIKRILAKYLTAFEY